MATDARSHVLFKMTGQRSGPELEAVDPLDLRPALLARYRDLTSLRYDFPLVLAEKPMPGVGFPPPSTENRRPASVSLSALIDDVLHEIAQGEDGERVSRHVLRLEREVRTMASRGVTGSLSALWTTAAGELAKTGDPAIADSLARARAAVAIDGEVVDCDADAPGHVVRHAWAAVQAAKAARFHADAGRLVRRLSDILRADVANSAAGRTAASLRASVGAAHGDLFDFDAMSRVLSSAAPTTTLPDTRRRRIREVLATLEAQRLYPPTSSVFNRCTAALAAYRERLPATVAIARALAIAELDAAGDYRESTHDAVFRAFGAGGLDPQDLSLFPDYLVSVSAAALDPVEHAALMDILSAGLPMKVLVQWDDLLDESPAGDGRLVFSLRSRQLTHMAMAQNEAYVLQASGAQLYQVRDRLHDAMSFRGPALVNVFSGATGHTTDLPPYLVAAAATESRAFPAFAFDPSAGADWASRIHLDQNPQADRDWPVRPFTYEDDRHQRASADVAFTLVDFAACDRRAARHFARVPRAAWNGNLVGVPDALSAGPAGPPDQVPALLTVDRRLALQKVIVDDALVREARRCREAWRNLRDLAATPAPAMTSAPTPAPVAAPVPAAPTPAPAGVPDAPAAETRASDDPYIETPRCSTCNECTRINPNMFAYNENKQAYIKNADAGTFAQLVEAAESCQLSIIHPGKPRNPNEPGLDELLKRAGTFQ